jgi:hypothetical protein
MPFDIDAAQDQLKPGSTLLGVDAVQINAESDDPRWIYLELEILALEGSFRNAFAALGLRRLA